MKLAITAKGPGPDYPIDESFGRAYWIMIFDTENGDFEALDNSELRNVLQGAGEKVSRWLAELDVDVVITGKTGPKALRELSERKIAIYHGACGSVMDGICDWRAGNLSPAIVANCEGSPFCLVSRSHVPERMQHKVELRLVKSS